MNVLSLFSGVGGFDMGLEAAGMRTIYQCEWDKHAMSILNRHWPDVPKWGDVSTLTATEILRHDQNPDVVAWGSPCQDLSVAGKRAGLSGERSGLFHEGIRIIKELRKETNNEFPRISIWENVAGALSSNGGADFGQVLDEMAEAGALVIEWAVLDAQHFGVPQRRRRVFVVAVFDPAIAERCPDPLLPVGESLRGDSKESKEQREEVTRSTHAGITEGSEPIADQLILFENSYRDGARIAKHGVTQTLSAKMGTGGGNTPMVAFATNQRAEVRELGEKSVSLSAQPGTNQQTYIAIAIQGTVIGRQDHNGPGGKGYTDNDGPMYTLTSRDIHAIQHDTAVRRLTPIECERLMGWPDDHTRWTAEGKEQADSHRYKQCGNGVASPVAKWIAQHILAI